LSISRRTHGIRVLKAVSSLLRLQILNLLFDKGPLSYTELMSSLKMNPSRDAGRFAYHLKFLLKADLVEAIVDQKKYSLTDLGKMVIDVADRIDKRATKTRNILVRASRSAIEEFDANKIANALIKEAKMPSELAQKVAKEAETQLLKSKTKYLTAPLVREVVNAILIEKGLEEYRNKLTRLGIPVHDVANLLHTTPQPIEPLKAAGETVFKEYTLLNALPRDIADAHLSGDLHINNVSTWLLKPRETVHDIRFFLQNGLNLETINMLSPRYPPPKNLETALSMIVNAVLHSAKETETTQTFEYFNTFLAPYAKDVDAGRIKEALHLFIADICQHANTAISLELTVPNFMTEKNAIDPNGTHSGKYKDYTEQTQLLASLFLEAFDEESLQKPLTNPKIILKVRSETLRDERAKAILLKAHAFAARKGTLYLANLTDEKHEQTVYSPSGFKLDVEGKGDWEIDTLRTGCLGMVTLNMARVAYESEGDRTRFFEILNRRLELANRALEIKNQTLRQYSKNLLPFLTQTTNGDQYFRLEKTSRTINLAGLSEASEFFTGKTMNDKEASAFSQEVVTSTASFLNRIGRRRGRHLFVTMLPNQEASTRLAHLDIERYGIAKIHFSGTRDKPYYSTTNRLALENGEIVSQQDPSHKTTQVQALGNFVVVELDETEHKAEELLHMTSQLMENRKIGVLKYNLRSTYCANCRRTWPGIKPKCPQCNAVNALAYVGL
jgi:anaerobic ribonucleoside-triphosphate reductase